MSDAVVCDAISVNNYWKQNNDNADFRLESKQVTYIS